MSPFSTHLEALFYFLPVLAINIYVFYPMNKETCDLKVFSKIFIKKARVFDTFMYNNEAEEAYIRIWRLNEVVDDFVIVVSNFTHSGAPKNVSFEPYTNEIMKYKDKIHLAYVPNNFRDPITMRGWTVDWEREQNQRDYGIAYIHNHLHPNEDDLILCSDCDEIFTKDAVLWALQNPPKDYVFIPSVTYYPYYFFRVENWSGPFIASYHKNNIPHLSNIRRKGDYKNKMAPLKQTSVTHCSFCFRTAEQYINKIKSFSHQEYNKLPYTTYDFVFKAHYCRTKILSPQNGYEEEDHNWRNLIPDDPRLNFLHDPSYRYDISKTNYTEKDLPNMCVYPLLNKIAISIIFIICF